MTFHWHREENPVSYLSPVSWDAIQPLVVLQHSDLPCVFRICQVSSCGRDFASAILSAWKVLSPAVCLAGSYSSFRSQVNVNSLERSSLPTLFSRSVPWHILPQHLFMTSWPFIIWNYLLHLFLYFYTVWLSPPKPPWEQIHCSFFFFFTTAPLGPK